MLNTIVAGVAIAALIVIFITWMKVHEMRVNQKLREEGKPPKYDEPTIVNVIDWSNIGRK